MTVEHKSFILNGDIVLRIGLIFKNVLDLALDYSDITLRNERQIVECDSTFIVDVDKRDALGLFPLIEGIL